MLGAGLIDQDVMAGGLIAGSSPVCVMASSTMQLARLAAFNRSELLIQDHFRRA
jgi:hypothetical protein